MFWWTRKRTQFQQICRRFRQKTWSFFSWIKGCAKKYSFQKKSPQNFPMDAKKAVSTTLLKLFLTKSRQFFVHCQQVIRKTSSKTFFSTKCSFWTRGTQVWPSFRNFFDKIPENFCSIADNDKELHFFPAGTIFLKRFLWKCRMCFWKLHRFSQQIDKKLSRKNQRR